MPILTFRFLPGLYVKPSETWSISRASSKVRTMKCFFLKCFSSLDSMNLRPPAAMYVLPTVWVSRAYLDLLDAVLPAQVVEAAEHFV
jgi:hypothetical protein